MKKIFILFLSFILIGVICFKVNRCDSLNVKYVYNQLIEHYYMRFKGIFPDVNFAFIEKNMDNSFYVNGDLILGHNHSNVYALYTADLNGDGVSELCLGESTGSGNAFYGIKIYDLVDKDFIFDTDDDFNSYFYFISNGNLCVRQGLYLDYFELRSGVHDYVIVEGRLSVKERSDSDSYILRTGVFEYDGESVYIVWDDVLNEDMFRFEHER